MLNYVEKDRLASLLRTEKTLQARWYARMSGEIRWETGYKDVMYEQFAVLSGQINDLISRDDRK